MPEGCISVIEFITDLIAFADRQASSSVAQKRQASCQYKFVFINKNKERYYSEADAPMYLTLKAMHSAMEQDNKNPLADEDTPEDRERRKRTEALWQRMAKSRRKDAEQKPPVVPEEKRPEKYDLKFCVDAQNFVKFIIELLKPNRGRLQGGDIIMGKDGSGRLLADFYIDIKGKIDLPTINDAAALFIQRYGRNVAPFPNTITRLQRCANMARPKINIEQMNADGYFEYLVPAEVNTTSMTAMLEDIWHEEGKEGITTAKNLMFVPLHLAEALRGALLKAPRGVPWHGLPQAMETICKIHAERNKRQFVVFLASDVPVLLCWLISMMQIGGRCDIGIVPENTFNYILTRALCNNSGEIMRAFFNPESGEVWSLADPIDLILIMELILPMCVRADEHRYVPRDRSPYQSNYDPSNCCETSISEFIHDLKIILQDPTKNNAKAIATARSLTPASSLTSSLIVGGSVHLTESCAAAMAREEISAGILLKADSPAPRNDGYGSGMHSIDYSLTTGGSGEQPAVATDGTKEPVVPPRAQNAPQSYGSGSIHYDLRSHYDDESTELTAGQQSCRAAAKREQALLGAAPRGSSSKLLMADSVISIPTTRPNHSESKRSDRTTNSGFMRSTGCNAAELPHRIVAIVAPHRHNEMAETQLKTVDSTHRNDADSDDTQLKTLCNTAHTRNNEDTAETQPKTLNCPQVGSSTQGSVTARYQQTSCGIQAARREDRFNTPNPNSANFVVSPPRLMYGVLETDSASDVGIPDSDDDEIIYREENTGASALDRQDELAACQYFQSDLGLFLRSHNANDAAKCIGIVQILDNPAPGSLTNTRAERSGYIARSPPN
jgi:hypothetical protein